MDGIERPPPGVCMLCAVCAVGMAWAECTAYAVCVRGCVLAYDAPGLAYAVVCGTLHRLRWCTAQLRARCMVPSRIFAVCCVRAAACRLPSAVLCGRNTTPCDSLVDTTVPQRAAACAGSLDIDEISKMLYYNYNVVALIVEQLSEGSSVSKSAVPACHPGFASSMLFMYLGRSSASRFSRRRTRLLIAGFCCGSMRTCVALPCHKCDAFGPPGGLPCGRRAVAHTHASAESHA